MSSKPAPFISPGKTLERSWTPINCYSQVTAKASEVSTGKEEYSGIGMKMLCTVGCVNTLAPVPALAEFTEKELLGEVLPHEGWSPGWRQSQRAAWGLNAQGLARRRAETLQLHVILDLNPHLLCGFCNH